MCLGGIGVTGTSASNKIAKDADCVIGIGTRMTDFTTSSKWLFRNEEVKFAAINISRFHAYKFDAVKAVGDARESVTALTALLEKAGYRAAYRGEVEAARKEWDEELARLGGIVCEGEDFEPTITARDPRTIPEFYRMYGTSLTQTAALATLRAVMAPEDIIVCAGGSLPSDLQRVWKTDRRGGYHVEYGYSCMGYEIGASMGVRMAAPDCEEYTVVGDAGFQMLSSELGTIMQERVKTNILVFDNCGFGCINNLEMTHGIGSLATEFRYTDGKKPTGDLIRTDYAKIGEAFGMKSYTCKSVEELAEALKDSRKQKVACLFDLKVLPKTMTDGYGAWWNVGIATTSESASVREACREVMEHREQARKY